MLNSLHIKNFRCFEDLTLSSLGQINLIVGKNSTGKSTLLEAIYVFARRGNPQSFDLILENRHEFIQQTNNISSIFFNRTCPDQQANALTVSNAEESDSVFCFCETPNKITSGFITNEEVFYWDVWFSQKQMEYPYEFVSTTLVSEDYLASLWDNISINSEDEEIRKSLHIIIKDLVNLVFIKSPNENSFDRIAIIKIKGQAKGIPLKSFGEGASRLLQIFLHALQAQNGFLLIDEFENGLHYSIQEEVWEKIFIIAKNFNIQVFATTHSEDALKAFSKVAISHKDIEGKLISLGRSAAIEDNGKILAEIYDEQSLAWFVESGMEVR